MDDKNNDWPIFVANTQFKVTDCLCVISQTQLVRFVVEFEQLN